MVGDGRKSAIATEAKDVERGERRVAGEFADRDEEEEGSQYYSDAEDQSWASHSRHNSAAYEDYISTTCASVRASSCDGDGEETGEHRRKSSCVSECSLDDVDLEAGLAEVIKASSEKAEKNCRICHLGLESAAAESGAGITLGCSCKGDLSYSHKQCALTWFKIRGNNSTVCNVVGLGDSELTEQWNESNSTTLPVQAQPAETRRFWQGHRFLNFLLACMVFAFVISWLFHFNVPG
ncbi:hypothetical protein GUJ93_ZPchr0010g9018 [Zizania palustris]|uniref:RING-CH-type domain-containing protein n=1 Tax=Zizania palustris TaxID=103762 RepID=A0A8J5WAV2_ZIZPA|nr:hypothetical protein GUJ93_ZPchr0010g10265 [Zizania palustris]KAG8085797.1 hypothetical protein GUJ93_ZPchr0010g9018 [Zizania palustris]